MSKKRTLGENLWAAVKKGDLLGIEELMRKGANINITRDGHSGRFFGTPLDYAYARRDKRTAKFLESMGGLSFFGAPIAHGKKRGDYGFRTSFGEKELVINISGYREEGNIARYPDAMALAIRYLREFPDAESITFMWFYGYHYDKRQTKLLKEIAHSISELESARIWKFKGPGRLSKELKMMEVLLKDFILDAIPRDPFGEYLGINPKLGWADKLIEDKPDFIRFCWKPYQLRIRRIWKALGKTKLIREAKQILGKGWMDTDSSRRYLTYGRIFQPQISPAFIVYKTVENPPKGSKLITYYGLMDAEVSIYNRHKKYYYLVRPYETSTDADDYFIANKAKEILANRKQQRAYSDEGVLRRYFEGECYRSVSRLAKKYGVQLKEKHKQELVRLLARNTVGFSIIEILLSDKDVKDIKIRPSAGKYGVYVAHDDYGLCETNISVDKVLLESMIFKLISISGKPFDKLHPELNVVFELPPRKIDTSAKILKKGWSLEFKRAC